MNNKALTWFAAALSILGGWGAASGQQQRDLRLKFNSRSLKFRLTVRDLQSAYTVTPSGDIRMHPAPPSAVLADDIVEVAIAEGPASAGRLTVRRAGQAHAVAVRADNSIDGATILTGLPFGYSFLPREGTARAGDAWRQDFPAPEGDNGARASAAYRYTFRGARPAPGCADCVEIEIQGVRRFLTSPALDRAMKAAGLAQPDSFYTEERPFALGAVQFSPKEGFLRRFMLSANPSMFTVLPVPGMMREIVFERAR